VTRVPATDSINHGADETCQVSLRLPHARPPLHGQVSSPADSPLPTSALPRMDRSHRQQTPSPHPRPPLHGQVSASRLPSAHARPPPHGQASRQQTPLSPAWPGLTASRLLSPRSPPPAGHTPPPHHSPLPTPALPRMDRSHRQQTPLSPRASPAWTGLTASRLPSPHARLPPHGQVSPPADSPLPTPALPRMDRSHRQQTPLSIAPPNPFPSVSP